VVAREVMGERSVRVGVVDVQQRVAAAATRIVMLWWEFGVIAD